MATYRIKLRSLTCHQKRSQGRYHDSVTVYMGWQDPANLEKHHVVVSRLGLGHPRYGETFYPGKTYRFERNNSGWPGTDIDWEFDLDIPDTGTRKVFFQVTNDRFVKDPYAVTKAVLAISAAVGGAVVGLRMPHEGFAAIMAAAIKGIGAEAVKMLLGSLFDDWPKCADLVFDRDIEVNKQLLEDTIFPKPEESSALGRVPSGCGQPRYTIEWSAERIEIPTVGETTRVVKTLYKPILAPADSKWFGDWIDTSGGLPFVAVRIERARHVVLVDGPRGFDITLREELPQGGSRQVLIDSVVNNVLESNRRGLPYNGKDVKASSTPRRFLERTAPWRLVRRAGGTGLEQDSAAFRVMGSFRSPNNLREVLSDNIRPIDLGGIDMDTVELAETAVAMRLLLERGASIDLPGLGVELRLYTVHETLEDGTIRESGPVLRYFRAATIDATLADLQLIRGSVQR